MCGRRPANSRHSLAKITPRIRNRLGTHALKAANPPGRDQAFLVKLCRPGQKTLESKKQSVSVDPSLRFTKRPFLAKLLDFKGRGS